MAKAYPILGHEQQAFDVPPHRTLDPFVAQQGGILANAR